MEANWIQERRLSLTEHWVLIGPGLRTLLRVLADLAEDRPEELKDFATGIRSLCDQILAPDALDPNSLDPEPMRATVKDLLSRTERAINQMYAVETLISQQETAQRESRSARDTLQRFLVDFHAGEHMVCYDALQKTGLMPRIYKTREVLRDAAENPFTRQRLADGIEAHTGRDRDSAFAEAEKWLNHLETLFAAIPDKQRLIDGRMADFSQLSAARYRYQTEMRGKRPEQVKAYMDRAAAEPHGRKFSALAHEPGMAFLSIQGRVYFGRNSLARARKKRTPVDLRISKPANAGDKLDAKEDIRMRNLLCLNPQRAARFVDLHLSRKGAKVSTEQIRLSTEDELLDLLAVLCFENGTLPRTRRFVKWRVVPERTSNGADPSKIPTDVLGDVATERFIIERIS